MNFHPRRPPWVAAAAMATAAAAASFTVPAQAALPAAEPVQVSVGSATLHGTLQAAATPGAQPLVFIHPGSGPTDRDGNTAALPGRNDSLKLLAEALAERGVASVRVDKRGIGASKAAAPPEADLRFGSYAADAAAWLTQLVAQPRWCGVVAAGHSEGALVVQQALAGDAALAPRIAGQVLLSAAGRPAIVLVREQLKPKLPAALYAQADAALTAIAQGKVDQPVPPGLDALLRPSLQPYLASWLPLDPATVLARSHGPVLVVSGGADAQVPAADAAALAHARSGIAAATFPTMAHTLKAVSGPDQQMAAYTDPTLPLAPGLADAVAAFVKRATAGSCTR